MDREQRREASRRWVEAASQTPEAKALMALGWQVVSPYGYAHPNGWTIERCPAAPAGRHLDEGAELLSDDGTKPTGTAAFSKFMAVLQLVADADTPQSIAPLARASGYPRPTVYRIVGALMAEGLLVAHPVTGRAGARRAAERNALLSKIKLQRWIDHTVTDHIILLNMINAVFDVRAIW